MRVLRRIPAVAWVWLVLLAAAWGAALLIGGGPDGSLGALLLRFATGPWGAFAILLAYALRGVVLFPSSVLTLFTGWALGPWWGALVAWLGVLASAAVAYGAARWVRRDHVVVPSTDPVPGRWARWEARLRSRGFEATLIARLASMPGDAVNVLAGASRAPFAPFLSATALGGAPGLLAVVLAGASLEGAFDADGVRIRVELLAASLALAVLAFGVSLGLRKRAR